MDYWGRDWEEGSLAGGGVVMVIWGILKPIMFGLSLSFISLEDDLKRHGAECHV